MPATPNPPMPPEAVAHHDVVCRIHDLAANKLMELLGMQALELAEEDAVMVEFLVRPGFIDLAAALDREGLLTILDVNRTGVVFDNDGDTVSETQAYRHRLVPWPHILSICAKRKIKER